MASPSSAGGDAVPTLAQPTRGGGCSASIDPAWMPRCNTGAAPAGRIYGHRAGPLVPRAERQKRPRPRAWRMGGSGEFTDGERAALYKAVFARRDVRTGFTDRPVRDATLARILNAAHHAPSVGFSQPWDFVVVRDRAARERIKASFDEERMAAAADLDGDPDRRALYLSLKLEGILDAPVNVCVTYDESRFGPFVIGRGPMPQTGVYSVCCAVQNLWLAARAEGVGVGWVSILSNEAVRAALGIPAGVLPVAYLCLGYVEEFAARPGLEVAGWLPRLGLGQVVHSDRWGRRGEAEWESMAGAGGGAARG